MLNNIIESKTSKKEVSIIASIVLCFFSAYYFLLLYNRIETDVQAHLIISYKFVNEAGPLTPNFLYFILVALFAGFSKYKVWYYLSSVLIIAVSLAAKFLLNYSYAEKCLVDNEVEKNKILLFSIGMLFVFCLPGADFFLHKNFFLGLLAPNVWHNSTIIFLFPFAIALFFETYFFLYSSGIFKRNKVIALGLLIILNILIKPSFLFTIIPAVFLCLIFEKTKTAKLTTVILYGGGLLLIILQYFIIYKTKNPEGCNNCSESVIIEPFAVWRHYASNIPVSFLSSFLFPLLFLFLSKGQILKDRLVRFAVVNWLVGILIYILFAESGERKFHGNFSWQMVTGNYLLFFVFGLSLWNKQIVSKISKASKITLQFLMYLHILWGAGYFIKIILFRKYA
jgi:hypothetical protein